MKELEKIAKDIEKQQIEASILENQQIEYRYDSSICPLKGHSLFEVNTKTFKVKKAKFLEHKDIDWFDALRGLENGWKREVVKNKDCVYISALNKKTALERFKNGKGSATMPKGYFKL
jgi:hypothetical protein